MRLVCLLPLLLACSGPSTLPDDAGGQEASSDACTSPTAWFMDQDGDGYGDALGAPVMACAAPSMRVANKLDCGDGEPLMHPGQTKPQRGPAKGKTAGSAYDYDCDGKATIVNASTMGTCDQCAIMNGWQLPEGGMVLACGSMYAWILSCDPQNACAANTEMRFPDCL